MELEELMTNRVLLEKMSENDMHPFRKHPKHVVIQENHAKPKEIRIEYKNSHNNISYTDTSLPPPPPPLVLEGYGCKCPHKLKRVMKILWVVLVVLYIFGMPVILVHMHTKLIETEERINVLEKRLQDHTIVSGDEVNVQASRQTKDNSVEEGNKRILPSTGMHKYKDSSYQDIISTLQNMEQDIEEHKRRIVFIENFQIWLNGTDLNGTDENGKSCFCLSQLPATDQLQQISRDQQKDGCKCKDSVVGKQGMQGLKGSKGKDGSLNKESIRSTRGPIGDRGAKGEPGKQGKQGRPGQNGTCIEPSLKVTQISTTYTRWGKSTCPKATNATTVYNGYVGGSYHTHDGGGSNYLCLPQQPKYKTYDKTNNDENRAYIYGVEFELGDSNIFDTAAKSGTYFDAVCSVCQIEQKSNAIMVPATTVCPAGWREEYHGYIMAQKRYLKRTEYICVDHKPDLKIGTENWGKGAFLHFVETRCGALPCRTNQANHYQNYLELSCVVCSS